MVEQDLIKSVVSKVMAKMSAYSIAVPHPQPLPTGISNRHVHLSQEDLDTLFGKGYKLQLLRDLSQTGQFAAKETVNIAGPKGTLEKVRVLGPVRKKTQVEVSRGDAIKLGVKPPVRESGDIKGSQPITVIGPEGSVYVNEGLIIAKRHIHMTEDDANIYGVKDGENVQVMAGGERSLVFDQVAVRVRKDFVLEFHVDIDEANAAGLNPGDMVYLIKSGTGNTVSKIKPPASRQDTKQKMYNREPLTLVTDETVRLAHKNDASILVKEGVLYTPLARDTIKELGVEVIIGE